MRTRPALALGALVLGLAACSTGGSVADKATAPDLTPTPSSGAQSSAAASNTVRTSPMANVPTAASTQPTAAPSQVDAARFKRSTGYYFASPSGHLHCGQVGGLTGCQSDRLVGNLPRCNRPTVDAAPMVALSVSGVKAECTSQGVFVVERATVLQSGQRVQLGDVTCTSDNRGITCTDQSGAQFVASEKSFQPG